MVNWLPTARRPDPLMYDRRRRPAPNEHGGGGEQSGGGLQMEMVSSWETSPMADSSYAIQADPYDSNLSERMESETNHQDMGMAASSSFPGPNALQPLSHFHLGVTHPLGSIFDMGQTDDPSQSVPTLQGNSFFHEDNLYGAYDNSEVPSATLRQRRARQETMPKPAVPAEPAPEAPPTAPRSRTSRRPTQGQPRSPSMVSGSANSSSQGSRSNILKCREADSDCRDSNLGRERDLERHYLEQHVPRDILRAANALVTCDFPGCTWEFLIWRPERYRPHLRKHIVNKEEYNRTAEAMIKQVKARTLVDHGILQNYMNERGWDWVRILKKPRVVQTRGQRVQDPTAVTSNDVGLIEGLPGRSPNSGRHQLARTIGGAHFAQNAFVEYPPLASRPSNSRAPVAPSSQTYAENHSRVMFNERSSVGDEDMRSYNLDAQSMPRLQHHPTTILGVDDAEAMQGFVLHGDLLGNRGRDGQDVWGAALGDNVATALNNSPRRVRNAYSGANQYHDLNRRQRSQGRWA